MGLGIFITVNNEVNKELTQNVSSVEVYEKIDQPTTYKIRFMMDICDEDIPLVLDALLTIPGSVLGVLVKVNDDLTCLVTGPVTRPEAYLQHGGAGSWLEVEGMDTSADMNREPRYWSWKDGISDAEIVETILKEKYNYEPDIEPTPQSTHSEDNHSLNQCESDLSLIRRLARYNSSHFWITYDKDGKATGHFKKATLEGNSVAEILVNMENANTDNLRISWDIQRISNTEGKQVNLRTKEIIGGKVTLSDETLPGAKMLHQLVGQKPQSMQLAPPVDDGGTMQARSIAALNESKWFIQASCRTSFNRLCKLVRLHTVVNVQGAGTRHSGKYYVTGVKHNIDDAAHIMDLELARYAWLDEQNENKPLNMIP